MSKFYVKIVLLLLLVMFSIFIGVDIANKGMERIQSPAAAAGAAAGQVKPPSSAATGTVKPAAAAPAKPQAEAPKPVPQQQQQQRIEQDEAMNYVGNKIGDLLQIGAHHAIQTVVSLFGGLFG
ncbi:hypothetical protein ACFFK0_25905 [Paenibacillus chartarius]|uniref:DUF3679 domain-containing protein n=1 Tax=Paenibacillus chartarius TaxID=747481 RepID=A0ABV6DT66_9BACL